jgi:hypothetical protein
MRSDLVIPSAVRQWAVQAHTPISLASPPVDRSTMQVCGGETNCMPHSGRVPEIGPWSRSCRREHMIRSEGRHGR